MSGGLTARLRAPLQRPAEFGEVLAGAWSGLTSAELARRPVYVAGSGSVPLGDLFEVTGDPAGRIRFEGDLSSASRVGAGLAEGDVVVDGNVGDEVGLGMAGGSIDVRGNAGARAGAAAHEARRGMTGGELVVRGSVAGESGSRMRRGLLAIGGSAGAHTGVGMIAGTVVVFGDAGPSPGLWSKRGSIVALGSVDHPHHLSIRVHLPAGLPHTHARPAAEALRSAGRANATSRAPTAATAATSPIWAREKFSHGQRNDLVEHE